MTWPLSSDSVLVVKPPSAVAPALRHSTPSSVDLTRLIFHHQHPGECHHTHSHQDDVSCGSDDACDDAEQPDTTLARTSAPAPAPISGPNQQPINLREPPEQLMCLICARLLCQPVVHVTCGTTMCSSCLSKSLAECGSEALCPFCRCSAQDDSLAPVPSLVHEMLDAVIVFCPTCLTEMLRSDLERHTCPPSVDLAKAWRVAPCPEGCGAHLQLQHLQTHIIKQCGAVTVTCTGSALSCSWQGQRAQLKEHARLCVSALAAERLAAMQQRLSEVQAEAEKYKQMYQRSDAALLQLESRLAHVSAARTEDVTIMSLLFSKRIATAQPAFDSALHLVDTLQTFAQHVLNEPAHMQPGAVRNFLLPALRSVRLYIANLAQRSNQLLQEPEPYRPAPSLSDQARRSSRRHPGNGFALEHRRGAATHRLPTPPASYESSVQGVSVNARAQSRAPDRTHTVQTYDRCVIS